MTELAYGVCILALACLLFALWMIAETGWRGLIRPAHSRDLGQWIGQDAAVAEWFATLKQPDNPAASCCGQADAYWADQVESGKTSDGEPQLIAVITDARDDAPLRRRHVPVGTRIPVPPNKIKFDRGNPTGHIVIFLGFDLMVWCYVQNGGV